MLTRDLLRYKSSGMYVKPSFISVSEPKLLTLAERLLAIFENSVGTTREELDEQLERITAAYNDVPISQKILVDVLKYKNPTYSTKTRIGFNKK